MAIPPLMYVAHVVAFSICGCVMRGDQKLLLSCELIRTNLLIDAHDGAGSLWFIAIKRG